MLPWGNVFGEERKEEKKRGKKRGTGGSIPLRVTVGKKKGGGGEEKKNSKSPTTCFANFDRNVPHRHSCRFGPSN